MKVLYLNLRILRPVYLTFDFLNFRVAHQSETKPTIVHVSSPFLKEFIDYGENLYILRFTDLWAWFEQKMKILAPIRYAWGDDFNAWVGTTIQLRLCLTPSSSVRIFVIDQNWQKLVQNECSNKKSSKTHYFYHIYPRKSTTPFRTGTSTTRRGLPPLPPSLQREDHLKQAIQLQEAVFDHKTKDQPPTSHFRGGRGLEP